MYYIFTIQASIRNPNIIINITNTPAIYCIKLSWKGLGVSPLLPRRSSERLRSNASQNWTAGDGGGSTTSRNAKYASRKCKDSSLTNPSTFEKGCEHVTEEALLRSRTCPSCTLKTPFLELERHILIFYP